MTQTPNYAAMSKADLIGIIESQKTIIQRFYRLLPVPNTALAPGEKLAWAAAQPLIHRETPNEKGLIRIPVDEIAEKIGMSESSASRYILNICERFEATHEVEPYVTKKGQKCNLTYIDPTDPIWTTHPAELPLPPEKERVINGNLPCPHCKSEGTYRVTKKRIIHYQEIRECAICHYREVSAVLDGEPPEEPTKKAPQPGDLFSKAQTSAQLTSINTPTPTAASEEKGPQAEDLFDPDAIYTDWLQRQIGQGQLIYATGRVNASDKYLSEEVGYTPDVDAYLSGDLDHIYGSNPLFEDGSCYFLWFDFDEKQPEHDAHYKEYMAQLAAGGVASLYFPRRPGRGHFGIAFNARVEAQAAYDFVIALCPQLGTVNECFPIGDKVKQRISWPLFQRIGSQVQACKCIGMTPSGIRLVSDGIVANRRGTARVLEATLTPAALVEAFVLSRPAPPEPDAPPDVGGVLLDSPAACCTGGDSDDLAGVVVAEMNNALSWQEAAGFDNPIRNQRFRATWRKHEHEDHTASVVIDSGGEYATDYGVHGSYRKKLDRYEVYCLTHRIDKTEDLKQRIRKRRQALQGLRRAS